MKKALTLFALLVLNTLSAQNVSSYSTYETLEKIESIQIHNNLCIILYPTNFYGIQIKGDKSLKDIIKWDFKDAILKLYTIQEYALASNAEITIYVNDFKELRLTESASVQTDKKITTETFALYSQDNSSYGFPMECKDFSLIAEGESSGYLDLFSQNVLLNAKNAASTSIKVQAMKMKVEQTDNSILSLSGNTQTLSIVIAEKARLTAWALKAKDVYLFSSNTEDINIYAENRLKINAQGIGNIYITGNPKQIDTLGINKKAKIFYTAQ